MGIHRKDAADLRGLIIPDSRIAFVSSYSAADSVLTEASPHAGVPAPLADSDMSLETSGSQSAAKDLRIKIHSPGHVDDEAARFIWQQTTGTDTNEKGWNPPFTGFRGVEIVGSAGTKSWGRTDILALSNGGMIATSNIDGSGPDVWYKRKADTIWAISAATSSFGAGSGGDTWSQSIEQQPFLQGAALVELPSGRVLCFAWTGPGAWTGFSTLDPLGRNIRCMKSDDSGVSWTLHSDACLPQFLTNSTEFGSVGALNAGPLKAEYKDGQILLISSCVLRSADPAAVIVGTDWTGSTRAAGNVWLQMASSDLGATLDIVEVGSGAIGQNGTGFDITVVNGEFVVAYLRNALKPGGGGPSDRPIGDIAVSKLGSAYQRLSNATVKSFQNAHIQYVRIGYNDGVIPTSIIWSGHPADPRIFNWELAITSSPEGDLYLAVCGFGYKQIGSAYTGGKEKQWNVTRLFTSPDAGATWYDPGRTWYDTPTADNEPNLSTWPGYAGLPDDSTRGGELFNWSGKFASGADRNYSRLSHMSLAWRHGQMVLLSTADKTVETTFQGADNYTSPLGSLNLFVTYFGGYSDLLRGHHRHPVADRDRSNLRRHYIPFDIPVPIDVPATTAFWGETTAGVHSRQIVWAAPAVNPKPRFELTTGDGAGAGGQVLYTAETDEAGQISVNNNGTDHIVSVDFALHVYHGDTPDAGNAISVKVRNGAVTAIAPSSPYLYELTIGFDHNKIVLYDLHAAAILYESQLAALGLAYPIHVRATVNESGLASVWASSYDPAATVKKWTKLPDINLTDSGAAAHPRIQWGHFTATGAATQNKSDWFFMNCGSGFDHVNAGPANLPAIGWRQTGDPSELDDYELCGRRITSVPVYVDDGVRLTAKDGPAVRGNEWQIKTRYDYGVENIHHEINASPDAVWRSTSDAAQVEIAWKVGPSSAAGGFSLNRVYGLYLGNINFKTAYLDVQADGSTSWTQVAEIDAADGMTGLAFDRKGNAIRPNLQTTTAGQYFPYNILAGSHVALNTGGATTYHPIETNSEGSFTGVATKRTTIRIGGDFAAASAGGPTVLCDIWSKESVALFHQMDTAHKIRLRIPAQTTAEGYFQIGAFIAGSVALFGRQHSRGHMREIQTNTDLTTQRSGVRRASVHGKARRAVELSWDDSVDLSEMQNAAPAPDFVSTMYGAIAGDPAPQHGVFNDGPTLVKGVLEATDGSSVPVVYLSRIPATDYDAGVVTSKFADRSEFLMGRIVSTKYRVENVLGDDSLNEVVTGTTIRIDEEL